MRFSFCKIFTLLCLYKNWLWIRHLGFDYFIYFCSTRVSDIRSSSKMVRVVFSRCFYCEDCFDINVVFLFKVFVYLNILMDSIDREDPGIHICFCIYKNVFSVCVWEYIYILINTHRHMHTLVPIYIFNVVDFSFFFNHSLALFLPLLPFLFIHTST